MSVVDGASVPGRDPRTRPQRGDRLKNPIIGIVATVTEVYKEGVEIDLKGFGLAFIPASDWPKTWGRKIIEVMG